MEITSLAFAGFVLLVFLVYHLLPHRAQNAWLLAASLVFYAAWDWRFALTLLALTLLNFLLGKRVGNAKSGGWLWTGMLLNVLVLAFFKYSDFFLPALERLMAGIGLQTSTGSLAILLPVGLSFVTVQAVAYLVDVRMGRMTPAADPLDFALFFLYFPKLVSGPIERARTFLPKLAEPRRVDNALLTRSAGLILLGLLRKVVVADALMMMLPEDVFSDPLAYPGQFLLVWLLAYAFALYNDFAGYTTIVRGVSGLFGIELARNFARPYFARNFTEFWQRWHISLSEWLRDYIFFPSARALMKLIPNRQHLVNLVLPPMVTMLVSGLWHGASWHMLLWGGLHGVYQVGERLISLRRPSLPPDQLPPWRQRLAAALVFSLTVLAWLPFRMELPAAADYLAGIFNPAHWSDAGFRAAASDLIRGRGFWSWPEYGIPDPRPFFLMLPSLWLDWRQEKLGDELFFLGWGGWRKAALLALALLAILLAAGADGQVPFVYQGF